MRYKKNFIALENFKINQNFQVFVEKLNKRQTSQNQRENTGGQGSCALQAYEIYYQMLHNQNAFKSVKYHFIEKEGFLDENFAKKNVNLAFKMRSYTPYKTLFFMMYEHYFLKARFLKTSNLRALLEKEEFFKVPILCNITSKAGVGHINILYRDEKGLFVINTNENSKNKIKLIESHNGDVFALEEIAYNWIGEFEDVKDFRLYIPYERVEAEAWLDEDLEAPEDFGWEQEDAQSEEKRRREIEYFKDIYGENPFLSHLNYEDYDVLHPDFEYAMFLCANDFRRWFVVFSSSHGLKERVIRDHLSAFLVREGDLSDEAISRGLKKIKEEQAYAKKRKVNLIFIAALAIFVFYQMTR